MIFKEGFVKTNNEGMYAKFRDDLLINVKLPVEDIYTNHSDEFREIIKNTFFDLDGPRYFSSETPSDKLHFSDIFLGFFEIEESFSLLADISVYIWRFPTNMGEIPKTRFFNYHIGNYFNEIYILHERLKSYKTKVIRLYKRKHWKEKVKTFEPIMNAFMNIVQVRGRHVHDKRFMDDDLDRLVLLEILSQSENLLIDDRVYKEQIRKIRKNWVEKITKNNKNITNLLDNYFSLLYDVVFDKKGNFIVPS